MEEQLKIIYLHGFNSSAESKKSKILDSYLEKEKLINLESPNLNNSPKKIKLIHARPKFCADFEFGLKSEINSMKNG